MCKQTCRFCPAPPLLGGTLQSRLDATLTHTLSSNSYLTSWWDFLVQMEGNEEEPPGLHIDDGYDDVDEDDNFPDEGEMDTTGGDMPGITEVALKKAPPFAFTMCKNVEKRGSSCYEGDCNMCGKRVSDTDPLPLRS